MKRRRIKGARKKQRAGIGNKPAQRLMRKRTGASAYKKRRRLRRPVGVTKNDAASKAAYSETFDAAYDRGYKEGFSRGFEDGHAQAYASQ